jgi:coenzyme F420-0:L-glutamate ligase / coenzyme F420-1:gamma-L-glutamate ligase
MAADPILSAAQQAFLSSARRAVLATIDPSGRPRLVPICFVLHEHEAVVYSALDDKPKAVGDPHALARVRDVQRDPRVSILVDRWDEDWTRLAWLRCHGTASLLEPTGDASDEHAWAVRALRGKYRQYETHDLAVRPLIRIGLGRVTGWGRIAPA